MNRLNGNSIIRRVIRHNVQSTDLVRTVPNAKLKPNQFVSLKLFKMKPYPETYTNVVVRNDGSSYRVWAGVEPHNIIAFPMDVSRMTEIDQQRITMMRTGEKIKPTTIIDIDVDDDEVEIIEKIAKSSNDTMEKKKQKNKKKNKHMSRSGTARIENRVKQKIKDGEYYEAHQMYRTIYARQKQNKQLANALRIVHDGALELFNVGEHGSAGDLCILYCSGLDEMECGEMYEKMAPTLHQQCQRLHMKTLQKLDIDQPERDQFEKRVITWSAQKMQNRCGNPVLREMIAENYWTLIKESKFSPQVNEVFYALARNNFIYARNSIRLAELLIEISMIDNDGREGVYFCMLALFQLLCDHCLDEAKVFYETFYKKHPKIKNTFPFDEPLLNMAHFLFAAIEMKNADTFMILYQNYSKALQTPDPSYARYMRRIGTIYFNIQEKKQQKPQGGLMGMIQNMMSELGGGGMGDSDDDSDDNQSGGLNNLMNMASSMLGNMGQQSRPQPKIKSTPRIVQDEDVDDLD